jgi:hypothetical protein
MDKKDRDWVEADIVGANNMAEGMTYPIIALALALIDKGTVDVGRLRDITASLRTVLELDFEVRLGELTDATLGLDRLEVFLTGFPWAQGQVVEQIRLHEASESAKSMLRTTTRKPPDQQ